MPTKPLILRPCVCLTVEFEKAFGRTDGRTKWNLGILRIQKSQVGTKSSKEPQGKILRLSKMLVPRPPANGF